MSSRCKSCDAPVEWVTMKDSGRAIPLDVGPGSTITAIDVRADGAGTYGVTVTGRRSHFATCPRAEDHRTQKAPSPTTTAVHPQATIRLPVDDEVRELVERQVVGAGGFQKLLLELRAGGEWQTSTFVPADPPASGRIPLRCHGPKPVGGELVAVHAGPDQVDRIVRYASQYGEGGYQGRLRVFVPGLRALARALVALADGGAQRKLFEDS